MAADYPRSTTPEQALLITFFTKAELALVDELSELIIPKDEHSPGAHDAEVAAEIDRHLGETNPRIPQHRELRALWRDGLRLFAKTAADKRLDLLTTFAAAESAPKELGERFFVLLKSATAFAYYTSEIGIRTDLEYKGNSYFDEFQGYAVTPAAPVKKP